MSNPFRSLMLALGAVAVLAMPAAAADYPTRPIKIVIGYGAGGSVDLLSRTLAEPLSTRLGQQVVVENRPGGGTTIATQTLVDSEPDGYTLMMADIALGAKPALLDNLAYDPLKDVETIVYVAGLPSVLAIRNDLPAETLAQLVDYLKSKPGELNYGSAGIGSMMHLAAELFKVQTGTAIEHIPYTSAAEGTVALVAGDIQVMLAAAPAMIPHRDKLRFLAVSNSQRLDNLADVPTFAEAGLPDFDVKNWQGLIAPKGTPPEVIARINAEVNAILAESQPVKDLLAKRGMVPVGGSPEEFRRFLETEVKKWADLITAEMRAAN